MADHGIQRTKRCVSCGGDYLLAFFRHNTSLQRSGTFTPEVQRYRSRCIGCEALRRREESPEQRLRRKAESARRRHAAKLKKQGIIKRQEDLQQVYGWTLERMINDIQYVWDRGCLYCLQPVNIAEQGLGAITLDILNINQGPYYSTNVRWCCATCNSEKQNTPADIWGARQEMWNQWRLNQIRLANNPDEFGLLFYDNSTESPLTLW